MGRKKTRNPWVSLADITPNTQEEFRDWLGKVIAGWRERIEPGSDEDPERAIERRNDLDQCLSAVVRHADRLGFPKVLVDYCDWLNPLHTLLLDSNRGLVLRDLRAIEAIVFATLPKVMTEHEWAELEFDELPPSPDVATSKTGSTALAAMMVEELLPSLAVPEENGYIVRGSGGATNSTRKTPKVKRGRKKLSANEARRRHDILTEWNRARNAGTTMKTFCQQHKPLLTVKELDKIVAWKATRDRRKSAK